MIRTRYVIVGWVRRISRASQLSDWIIFNHERQLVTTLQHQKSCAKKHLPKVSFVMTNACLPFLLLLPAYFHAGSFWTSVTCCFNAIYGKWFPDDKWDFPTANQISRRQIKIATENPFPDDKWDFPTANEICLSANGICLLVNQKLQQKIHFPTANEISRRQMKFVHRQIRNWNRKSISQWQMQFPNSKWDFLMANEIFWWQMSFACRQLKFVYR
mgnify:CR=1 FL=1